MDTLFFIAGLFLFTMIAFLTWAAISKKRTEEKLNDPNAPKSALAKDGPGPNPMTEGIEHRDRQTSPKPSDMGV